MATIAVGTDHIRSASQDNADLQKFCDALKNAGHTVSNVGRSPNAVQSYMLKSSHSCDVMIQIAGGLCIGTLGDFIAGIKRGYYHAKKGAIVYNMVANNLNAKTWKATKAWDWYYSMSTVTPYLGKTLPQVYNENKDVLTGFADGKNIDEVIKNYLNVIGGGSSTTSGNQQGGGGNILELVKQVCSDWDPLGVEINLDGDTVGIRRTNPNTAVALGANRIQLNTVSMVDYDSNTPNVNGTAKDQFLIKRFGEVPMDAEVNDSNKAQVLQVAQRGHNHSIDLKCILGKEYNAGNWVKLTIPELGIENRPYYISKSGNQEERVTSLTLESAPPSRYVEVQEMAAEEEVSEDTTEG